MNTLMKINAQVIDQNELQVHRLFSIMTLLTAIVLGQWELVPLQGVIFGLAFLNRKFSPYVALYHHVLRPSGLVHPDPLPDHMAPHRFANIIGLLVSLPAAYLLATGYASIGWALVWLIIVLAIIAFFGWCTGCFMYYMFNRLGLKGFFSNAPLSGAFPGSRPPKSN